MPSSLALAAPLEDPGLLAQAVEVMGRVPIFQTLSPDEIQALAAIARIVDYAPGETLFHPGDAATTLHVVLEGTVRMVEETADGPMRMVATREPGQCYGEIGFLSSQPRLLGALNGPTPGRHVVIDRGAFEALATRIPAIGQAVLSAQVDTLVRRMDNVPPYVRDYLLWGHRPRVTAPPAARGPWSRQAFVLVGGAWGIAATLLWLWIEPLAAPNLVRTLTQMGLMMGVLTGSGALAGLVLSLVASAVSPTDAP